VESAQNGGGGDKKNSAVLPATLLAALGEHPAAGSLTWLRAAPEVWGADPVTKKAQREKSTATPSSGLQMAERLGTMSGAEGEEKRASEDAAVHALLKDVIAIPSISALSFLHEQGWHGVSSRFRVLIARALLLEFGLAPP